MDKEKVKKIQKGLIGISLVLLVVMGISYAWLTLRIDSEKVNILKAGSLDLVLDDETADGILLEKAIPQSYQQGITNTEYNFTLTNNGTTAVDYELTLEDLELASGEVRMADSKVRYILVKNNEAKDASNSKLVSEADDRIIDEGTIEKDEIINYTLQVWIDSKATNEVMGQIFYTRLKIDAIQSSNLVNDNNDSTLIYYYSFGVPTQESLIDYSQVGIAEYNKKLNVFNALGSDGSRNVCIDSDGLFCIKENEYDITKQKLINYFGADTCKDYTTDIDCKNELFQCKAYSHGGIRCDDLNERKACYIDSSGSWQCLS